MKRLWFGCTLLVLFLALSLSAAKVAEYLHDPVAQLLEQASQSALTDQWEHADTAFREAHTLWDQHWKLAASLTDHAPMEEIDALFAQAAVYARRFETTLFADTCAKLQSQLTDLIDAQAPTWWNLL